MKIDIYNDAQKFYRPDGSIKAVHCGWISTIQDDWQENKVLNNLGDDDCESRNKNK